MTTAAAVEPSVLLPSNHGKPAITIIDELRALLGGREVRRVVIEDDRRYGGTITEVSDELQRLRASGSRVIETIEHPAHRRHANRRRKLN